MKRAQKVLIAGGGPVGLSLSLLLHNQGIESCILERYERSSGHAKAHYLSMRSMEILEEADPALIHAIRSGTPSL